MHQSQSQAAGSCTCAVAPFPSTLLSLVNLSAQLHLVESSDKTRYLQSASMLLPLLPNSTPSLSCLALMQLLTNWKLHPCHHCMWGEKQQQYGCSLQMPGPIAAPHQLQAAPWCKVTGASSSSMDTAPSCLALVLVQANPSLLTRHQNHLAQCWTGARRVGGSDSTQAQLEAVQPQHSSSQTKPLSSVDQICTSISYVV